MDANKYQALTFDCYGTLIDWKDGINRLLALAGEQTADPMALFEYYVAAERKYTQGPYMPYRQILWVTFREVMQHFRIDTGNITPEQLIAAFEQWQPFPDTTAALLRLKSRYRLAILSNIDDDLFALTLRSLKVDFDEIITAQQVGSYKPDLRNFKEAVNRVNLPAGKILHIGQSLFHDMEPARLMGIDSIWINRYRENLEINDGNRPLTTLPDLNSLADLLVS